MEKLIEIRRKAIQLLSMREHSRQELQQKLLQRGYASVDIFTVLDDLAKEKLQSDERFAEAYVHSRGSKGYGPERIRLELQQKGISELIIDVAMATTDIRWQELAQIVYQKKFGNSQPDDFKEKMKRQQFMRYRGFKETPSKTIVTENDVFGMWESNENLVDVDDFVHQLRKPRC